MRRLALKCVLSDKARQERLVCLDRIDTVDGKTRSMVDLLQKLEVSGSALVVTRGPEEPIIRASHNLKKVWTLPVTLLNAHELLRRETVIMTVEAARWAEQFLSAAPENRLDVQETEPLAIADALSESAEDDQPEKQTAAVAAPVDTEVSSDEEEGATEAEAVATIAPAEADALPEDEEDAGEEGLKSK
jgi:hypothetical protein